MFLGDGGVDEFIGEGGDDIMVGSLGRNKMIGQSGWDWATYKDFAAAVDADLSRPIIFDEAPLPPGVLALDTYEAVEGLSGSMFNDILKGSNITADQRIPFDLILNPIPLEGFQGSELDAEGIARITNLDDLMGGLTFYSAGDIILGGGGSDEIWGQGGDDIIDGDRWLNTRISVRQNIDGTGPEIASHNSMTTLSAAMAAGTINPGQLVIAREILQPGVGQPATQRLNPHGRLDPDGLAGFNPSANGHAH